MNIQTVQFAHILENRDLDALHDFLSQTAFVISHKNESIETVLRVLWYIPVNSTIIIVTNCAEHERDELARALKTRLVEHHKTYLIHQKDEGIAQIFQNAGVSHILGTDGKVLNGKGEGMYIGALCAHQLGYPRWLIFYDADNFVPSALLEYTLAMCRLFMSPSSPRPEPGYGPFLTQKQPDLHNIRICWASKPDLSSNNWQAGILGRTTKVVSPLFESLLEGWFSITDHTISSSNAGEQGMTVKTATTLRFSSGFSVETFQLLDLLYNAALREGRGDEVIFQQYLSQSPHFHEKKGDEHIKGMIEESLGCFFHFETVLPENVRRHLQVVYDELQLERVSPAVYPALQDLPLEPYSQLMQQYALFKDLVPAESIYLDLRPISVHNQDFMTASATCQDILLAEPASTEVLIPEANLQELLVADPERPPFMPADTSFQDVLLAD